MTTPPERPQEIPPTLASAYADQLDEIAEILIRAGKITRESVASNGVRYAVMQAFETPRARAQRLAQTARPAEADPGEVPTDGAWWGMALLALAPEVVFDAVTSLRGCADLRGQGLNALSTVGNFVSAAARRAVLRRSLERHRWSLGAVSRELRLGGVSNVLRLIKDLGLKAEIEQARRDGLIKRGGSRKRGPRVAPGGAS